jgi:hypothetical protein
MIRVEPAPTASLTEQLTALRDAVRSADGSNSAKVSSDANRCLNTIAIMIELTPAVLEAARDAKILIESYLAVIEDHLDQGNDLSKAAFGLERALRGVDALSAALDDASPTRPATDNDG